MFARFLLRCSPRNNCQNEDNYFPQHYLVKTIPNWAYGTPQNTSWAKTISLANNTYSRLNVDYRVGIISGFTTRGVMIKRHELPLQRSQISA